MSTQFKNENSSLINSIKIDHEKLPSQIKETIASQENNGLFIENEQKVHAAIFGFELLETSIQTYHSVLMVLLIKCHFQEIQTLYINGIYQR